jgi:hypothetical protein
MQAQGTAGWAPGPGLGLGLPFDGNENFSYSMVKSGPDVAPDEVEVAHAPAVEVMILWDSNVLHVSHLAPPRPFFVGEEEAEGAECDYFIPSETLGIPRAPLVTWRGLDAVITILPRSRGYVDVPGQGRVTLADLVSSGRARRSGAVSGAHEYELAAGASARMEITGSALVLKVSAVNAGKKVPGGLLATLEPAAFLFTGVSFLVHLGLVATFAFFMPHLGTDDSESLDRDRILMMQKLLNAAAQHEQDDRLDPATDAQAESKPQGGQGQAAKNESGAMGSLTSRETGHKYGVQGEKNNPDPHLAVTAALDFSANFGMIGLVSTLSGANPQAPTAAWGREDASGVDDRNALGNMFGDVVGESAGTGGLGLTGTGEGGGGPGEGIGIGNFGTLGHGGGMGNDQGLGLGRGHPGGTHKPRSPGMRESTPSVNGKLPAEVIQRIVRQNFGRFRLCYESGLRGNPGLQGRVAVKFIIDRSGAISLTADGGSDLPDQGVVQCVVRGFGNLSFPQPEGGMVTVVYPIMFSPGDQ